jgi:hypothetical protein
MRSAVRALRRHRPETTTRYLMDAAKCVNHFVLRVLINTAMKSTERDLPSACAAGIAKLATRGCETTEAK